VWESAGIELEPGLIYAHRAQKVIAVGRSGCALTFEVELELIQTHMIQKQFLWVEVYDCGCSDLLRTACAPASTHSNSFVLEGFVLVRVRVRCAYGAHKNF
jgi:hypothetical protein